MFNVAHRVAIAEATSFKNMRLYKCVGDCLLAYVIARFGVCLFDFVSRKKGLKPAGSFA